MEDKTEEMLNKINRGIVVNRILLIAVLLVSGAALVFSIMTNIKFNTFVETATPAIENLAKLDMDEFNSTIHTINQVVDVFKIDETMETLSKVDFDAFNDVVTNIDVDELNTTLDHLNEAYLAIKDVTDKLKPLLSFFGGSQ